MPPVALILKQQLDLPVTTICLSQGRKEASHVFTV
jgi:hypothetical protein